MENLNLDTIRLSRDLLQRFVSLSSKKNESEVVKRKEEEEEEELDVELTLGLSLGGRFGVDKSCKLTRSSSSTAACLPIVRDSDDVIVQPTTGNHSLVRSSSLPVESEVEWRKRKELQTLRRMEAKKRRSEKQRISMADKGVPKGKSSHVHRPPLSQVSIQSHRGRSSSISELDFKALQGSSSGNDFSPVSIQTLEEGRNKNVDSCAGKEDMPSVFTRGDGPNGTRVDGILYKYGKGEEVRIMCVCHGILFSPEEFVKHAGGSDVTHPLKHIVVNPVSSMMVLK